ncbi:helicase-related protein [Sphingomonas sp. KR1UV-12]|uniref:Transcription-repair-coupling factor n=1 Tax=Sphingomonas aurea TaxID=3063994 RepID=A0ABT9EK61_9SPHN|nr:helicase-related protein [Sphingomonas sp. KR1UV-12]MDP1027217.1 helicase-related protein [Sphingomonas sp. KR1UV-12]
MSHPISVPTAIVAAALAEADGDVVFVAADAQRAALVAEAVCGLIPDAVVANLPSGDALPGDAAPASPANVGQRVAALRRVRAALNARNRARVVLVTTAEASAVRYPVPDAFDAAPPAIDVGAALDAEAFAAIAAELGYQVDDRVDEPGEIAIRGQVIDIFPVDHETPVRIEVEDGRAIAIRRYDPVTQRTTDTLDRVELGRAVEPAVEKGVPILAHLPDAAVAIDPEVAARRDRFLAIAGERGARRRKPAGLVTADDWDKALADRKRIDPGEVGDPPPRFVERRAPLRAFARFVAGRQDAVLVIAGSARDLRFLAPRLGKAGKIDLTPAADWSAVRAAEPGSALLLTAAIDRGFARGDVIVIAAADLLGGRAGHDAGNATAAGAMFGGVGDLALGDVVVHEDFGIGMVEGVEPVEDGGDALVLGYAKGARRLVPVAEADRVWRYGADGDGVALDSLDGASWQKRRGAIDQAVAESARTLATLAAEREARTADPIVPDAAGYERFAGGFAFTETADQARAIAAVRGDLASGRPMDRLVVGDVGYGKTEVALRAAALVALAGRQVVIAAPTTVLVRQHLDTFRRRFEGTGIEVAGLSRLSSAAERKRVIAGLKDGSVGVVVGTGAVAGKGVGYRDLALVVIDEEQRFGAADKAKLAGLGAGHVLTLSATPIPRTLQSALVGLQDISIIATPPARRQPIRTAVQPWDDAAVRAALVREQGNGGQSFVVVPRIEDMAPLADKLGRLVPELTLVQAHGKMPAAEIDEAMVAFAGGEGDVLLATNIIEAGLDVPRANTMIVHHADRFGLAQLHQLRGRVGRSGRRGQVMLTTVADAEIAPATLKRLRTLQAFDRLGAGFAISARDLDLRGAGDLIGEEQAGHMKLIGIDLYQYLLTQALRQARGETVDSWTPELSLGVTGRLPEAWIPELEVRLALYGRLARLQRESAIDAFEEELEDRFGAIPAEAAVLLDLARVRRLAWGAGIVRIDAGPAAIAFTPRHAGTAVPDGLVEKKGRWLLAERIDDAGERLTRVAALLGEWGGD